MKPSAVLSSLLVIALTNMHPASGQEAVSWVALEVDLMAPNALRINTLDAWFEASENIDFRLGLGGLALLGNLDSSSPKPEMEFWHFLPIGLSYGLGNGCSLEGMIEGLTGPAWNTGGPVDQGDDEWVPGKRISGTVRHLAFRWSTSIEEWGSFSVKTGIRGCSEIDVYDGVWGYPQDYIGRFRPYSRGFFIQASVGFGDWRDYRWGVRKARKKSNRNRPVLEERVSTIGTDSGENSTSPSDDKEAGKISFSENDLDISVENIFVIEGKGQSCRQKSIESGVLDVVGQKLIGPYNVLERQMLDVVLEEQRLAMSGLVFEATAVEAGCLQGADGVVFCQYGCIGEDELLTVKLVDCKTSSQLWALTGINAAIVDVVEELEKRLR